jgi:methionine-rich copper-binding protein CopC
MASIQPLFPRKHRHSFIIEAIMHNRFSIARAILISFLFASFCQNTLAEGILIKIQPRDNEAVTAFDGNVKLWFGGNVSERSPTLVVLDSQGNRVDNSDLKLIIADRSELSASTRPLTAGKYVIRYRVVTDDGLIVSGISRFSVKP